MAFQQASNKGTLVPGQKISVNSYTVQVERYLSQGSSFHSSFPSTLVTLPLQADSHMSTSSGLLRPCTEQHTMFLNVSQFQTSRCLLRLRRRLTSWYVTVLGGSCFRASLTDCPKRILKGHPNIVHLIDAAWNKTSNGVYEVFILMEYCPGSLHGIYAPANPLTI